MSAPTFAETAQPFRCTVEILTCHERRTTDATALNCVVTIRLVELGMVLHSICLKVFLSGHPSARMPRRPVGPGVPDKASVRFETPQAHRGFSAAVWRAVQAHVPELATKVSASSSMDGMHTESPPRGGDRGLVAECPVNLNHDSRREGGLRPSAAGTLAGVFA